MNPAATGAQGVRGVGPVGGMMGAGGGGHGKGGKDDGGEHKIPKLLVNMDNTERLVGPLKPASPAVIGDWDTHEREDPDFRHEPTDPGDFDRLARIIVAAREVAETVRTHGLDRDGGWGIAWEIPSRLHMIAAETESELRWWLVRDICFRLRDKASSAFENGELRVGTWPVEITHVTPLSYVAYPQPDLATCAQRLSSAAENLRIQAVALAEAVIAPLAEYLCRDLREIAERIGNFAGVMIDDTCT